MIILVAFVIGLFAGAAVGVFVGALCCAAGSTRENERYDY